MIDGACRDTYLCRNLNYPVYTRSYSMRTGKDRVQVAAMNVVDHSQPVNWRRSTTYLRAR